MYTIEKKTLTDIADAIREKTGKSGLILPGDMPGEIEKIKDEKSYEILEYIESNGTQGIDTGIFPSMNTVYCCITTFDDKLWSWALGAISNDNYCGYRIGGASTSKIIDIYNGNTPNSNVDHAVYEWSAHPHGFRVTIKKDVPSAICIFTCSINGEISLTNTSKNKFYSMRIGDNYLVPARRIYDQQVGILNMYTGKLLVDALDGDPFIVGPIIFSI